MDFEVVEQDGRYVISSDALDWMSDVALTRDETRLLMASLQRALNKQPVASAVPADLFAQFLHELCVFRNKRSAMIGNGQKGIALELIRTPRSYVTYDVELVKFVIMVKPKPFSKFREVISFQNDKVAGFATENLQLIRNAYLDITKAISIELARLEALLTV